MRTKLLGITLIFCLVLSVFGGMTAAAEGNLFINQKWEINDSGVFDSDGTLSMNLGSDMPVLSKQVTVSAQKSYRLSFEYALNFDRKGELKVAGMTADGNARAIVEPIRLGTTSGADIYKEYVIIFSPGYLQSSPITTAIVYFEGKPIKEWESGKFNIRNIFLQEIPAEAIANGSAEYLDENNQPFGITGGTVVRNASFAKDGNNVMELASGETMTMNLGLEKTGVENVKIRGYIQAKNMSAGSSVKVTFWKDAATTGTKIAEKTYTFAAANVDADASFKDIQNGVWEYFRFSNLPMGDKIVVEFSVEGNGSVYVDGVTIEEDKNIATTSRFVEYGDQWWINGENGASYKLDDSQNKGRVLKTDGDCPDGQNYIHFDNNGSSAPYTADYSLEGIQKWEVEENEKYLFSFWYKTSAAWDGFFRLKTYAKNNDATTTHVRLTDNKALTPHNAFWPTLQASTSTEGKWEQLAMVVTIPKGVDRVSLLFTNKAVTTHVAFCNISLEKIEEETIRFFEPSVKSETGTNLFYALEPEAVPFVTILGKPVEVRDEVDTNKLAATCLVPTINGNPYTTSQSKMIFAWYEETSDGTRRLAGVKIGEAPVPGTNRLEGFDDLLTNAGKFALAVDTENPLPYMDYPSISVDTADFENADIVRAFCWDTISGLRAVADVGNMQ